GPRRPRHVLKDRRVLNRTHQCAKTHRNECGAESLEGDGALELYVVRAAEGDPQCERAAHKEHVLEQLRVRTETCESDHDREHAPHPVATVANAANEQPQNEWEERTNEQFPV